jgi:dTDP-4-dehydrorhamnose reductase
MMEIWGGVECTVNRVGDRYFDQVVRTGHHVRADDLNRFASLGIKAIRYPLLWERVAPQQWRDAFFDWTDVRLERLRELGLRPIAGLVHHGSGPSHTDLTDPAFPSRLAEFARAAAERYPWIREWTPVNEPVTTARFSGLYGHWYPHARSDAAFVRMVLNQARAIVEAMEAIRSVIPDAQLLHTDDAGMIFSTEPLVRQAEFENARRDLVLDLLFGRVNWSHPLWQYLIASGAAVDELEWFARHPCPPDTIGANYYVTSDRLLDHRVERYPPDTIGGNGRQQYADVAAVRADPAIASGFQSILERYYARYGKPVALTEVHIACTREDQLRWLAEAWSAMKAASAAGIPARALCVWSLLGAYDWNRLVTLDSGDYESGVFDIRASQPRPTALYGAVRQLATTGALTHPLLNRSGWWRRGATDDGTHSRRHRKLLLLGPTGTLGSALVRRCADRGIDVVALGRHDVDITRATDVSRAIGACQPWAVINATGFVDVDGAESNADACMAVNCTGATVVAQACSRVGAALVAFSSDLVFDGSITTPYVETHPVAPLNTYGRSKVELERSVLEALPTALVVRTSAFMDAWDVRTFTARILQAAARGERILTSSDVVSPTYVPALADAVLDLLIDGESGVWHLANQGAVSWTTLAQTVLAECGGDANVVEEVPGPELGRVAPRPSYSALGSQRGNVMPSLEQSLEGLFRARARTLAHAT